VELGERIDLGNKTSVVLTAPTVIDNFGVLLQVHVRAENSAKDEHYTPDIDLVCAGSTEDGGWQANSTFNPQRPLPAGSYAEGDINLIIPGDQRAGGAVPECATPAYLQVVPWTVMQTGDPDIFRIPLDDTLIAELNAQRAQ
jgi:hypothetical protein